MKKLDIATIGAILNRRVITDLAAASGGDRRHHRYATEGFVGDSTVHRTQARAAPPNGSLVHRGRALFLSAIRGKRREPAHALDSGHRNLAYQAGRRVE